MSTERYIIAGRRRSAEWRAGELQWPPFSYGVISTQEHAMGLRFDQAEIVFAHDWDTIPADQLAYIRARVLSYQPGFKWP